MLLVIPGPTSENWTRHHCTMSEKDHFSAGQRSLCSCLLDICPPWSQKGRYFCFLDTSLYGPMLWKTIFLYSRHLNSVVLCQRSMIFSLIDTFLKSLWYYYQVMDWQYVCILLCCPLYLVREWRQLYSRYFHTMIPHLKTMVFFSVFFALAPICSTLGKDNISVNLTHGPMT
jgi:hypothetical protein